MKSVERLKAEHGQRRVRLGHNAPALHPGGADAHAVLAEHATSRREALALDGQGRRRESPRP
jgi:hypothetical protein